MPSNPKILIVEGGDDRHSVIGLMRAHIAWPRAEGQWPVYIEIGNGAEEILQVGNISAKLKARELKVLGIMLDADTKPRGRYQRILEQCLDMFPGLPHDLPATGLIADNGDGKRLGVWIMPDNESEGCTEVFLRHLVPAQAETSWQHAVQSVIGARELGAPCRECHLPKAHLYTWLAWQDPPGQSPGIALTKKILDPTAPSAARFVTWFRLLYGI